MSEEKFKQLLKKLKIAENKSYEDIMELLDAKLDEYLDRQDEASKEVVSQIHDALDYAEEMQKEVGSGITIKSDQEEEEEPDFDDLKNATNKKEDTAKPKGMSSSSGSSSSSSSDSKGSAKGKLWFVSTTGAANVDNMFLQAEDDLKYGEWEHATNIFETVLQVEANNPSAYLGRVLAKYQLSTPREIGSCIDQPIDADVNLRRAHDHGNPAQAKYIEDALKERENAIKYKEIEKAYQAANTEKDFQNVAAMFNNISYYRDAGARATQCLNKAKELVYQQACSLMRKHYNNAYQISAAINTFSTITDYKDSYDKMEECKKRKTELLYEDGVSFLKEKSSLSALKNAANNFAQIKGYKDADSLLEECKQLIPEFEGSERKNKDVEQFERALSKAALNTKNPSACTSDLLECESVYKKVAEIKKSGGKEAHYYDDVNLKEWNKRIKGIKGIKKGRKDYLGKERLKNVFAVFLIFFTFLLGPIWVLPFTIDIPGFMAYMPISYIPNIDRCISIQDSKSPVLFSLVPGDVTLDIESTESLKYVIMPFARITIRGGVNQAVIIGRKNDTDIIKPK